MTTATLVAFGLCFGALVAVACFAGLALRAQRQQARRTEEALTLARSEAAELRARVDALSVAAAAPQVDEYVITDLGMPSEGEQPTATAQRIDGRLFLDIIARESVVKAASFGHGVRTVFSPVNRNRIRFEMKREVKRRRKERRTIVRNLRREAALRQRMMRNLGAEESA